jgi:hypothetical protein
MKLTSRKLTLVAAVAVAASCGSGRVVTSPDAPATSVAVPTTEKATFGEIAHDVDGDGIVSLTGAEAMPTFVLIGPGLNGEHKEPRYVRASDLDITPVQSPAEAEARAKARQGREIPVYDGTGKQIDVLRLDAPGESTTTTAGK